MQNDVPYTAIWDFKPVWVAKEPRCHIFVDLVVGRMHRMGAGIHEDTGQSRRQAGASAEARWNRTGEPTEMGQDDRAGDDLPLERCPPGGIGRETGEAGVELVF